MNQNIPAPQSPIRDAGGPPPQRHLADRFLDEEDLLLFAAWAHGLTLEDTVHRYTLFAFIQTHLSGKAEEQLQRTVESSTNWDGQGNGRYKLTERGEKRILRKFGERPVKAKLNARYVLSRTFQGIDFSVNVSPHERKLEVAVGGNRMKGTDACRKLERCGATFHTNSTSRLTRVLNWIVQGGDFLWRRLA